LSWAVTLVLTAWKTFIPSAPNVINLDAILYYVKSSYKIRTSTKMHFKLFEVAPPTTYCNKNNKRIICQPSTTYACIETHDNWSQVMTSSQEREMNEHSTPNSMFCSQQLHAYRLQSPNQCY
jgi:hypothetical protein